MQAQTSRKPLRLWPGIALAILVVILRYLAPLIGPDAELFSRPVAVLGIIGGMLSVVAIAVWWLLFSRAPWLERLGALVLMAIVLVATRPLLHESIQGGMMGAMQYVYSIPLLGIALVVWAAATQHLADGTRRAALVAAMVLACLPLLLLRTAGSFGAGSEFHWRWTPTPEERLLAQGADEPKAVPPPAPAPAAEAPSEPAAPTARDNAPADAAKNKPAESASAAPPAAPAPTPAAPAKPEATTRVRTEPPAEWPGFRGPRRDSVVRGVHIDTDWSASPPVEIWRRPIGPGWSSFAVRGDLVYTQEQRGEEEMVSCYRLSTGQPVWRHRDPVRFWESNGGPGPRGTPTLSDGRVYAFGATGILNALDAHSGKRLWSRNVSTDTDRRVPDWGFSSSPLVVDDLVIVAASGSTAAYDAATGERRWIGRRQLGTYSSPHLVTVDGVRQVLLLSGSGAVAFAPADGAVLWEHQWTEGGATIVQPAVTPDGGILISALAMAGGAGLRRLDVTRKDGRWTVAERWTSNGLKPYFNDFVVHEGHAYGFDGSILSCIDLETGTRKWKGGRYGNGQLVLLPDQDVLLVVSEEGELVLVNATPDQFKELARAPALNGKTWNHPVLVRNVLLVRNGEEMAAFRIARSDTTRRTTSVSPVAEPR